MTMADRNIRRRRHGVHEHTYSQDLTPRDESQSTDLELNNDVEDLHLCNSSVIQPTLPTRDSGYNTDFSPATTVSPATNTLPPQHFIYGDLSQADISQHRNTASPHHLTPSSPHLTIRKTNSDRHDYVERTSKSNIHLPPNIRPLAILKESSYHTTHVNSPSLSESSDTNRVQFDFESDDENPGEETFGIRETRTNQFTAAAVHSRHCFDLSGNPISFFHDDIDEDEDDSIFYQCKSDLNNWENVSEPYTPRFRKRSKSLRQRRYCSEDLDDDLIGGAYGGCDPCSSAPELHTDHLQAHEGTIIQGSNRNRLWSGNEHVRKSSIIRNAQQSNDSIVITGSDSSLTGSQGFKPGYFDSDSRDNDSNNVFFCDDEAKDGSSSIETPSQPVVILRDRPAQKPAVSPSSRQRRHSSNTTANVLSSLECLPPWCSTFGGVSVSTQTPHLTSVMIQQIMHTPVALPNEARGTAASRLHRLSESGVPVPPGPSPLPDIITSVGRDRSQSVPNLQTIVTRHRAREVGRELRRLSDEFNIRRNLTPVNEEFDGHPASYPRMQPTYLRDTINQFGALLRHTFRGRHNSSS